MFARPTTIVSRIIPICLLLVAGVFVSACQEKAAVDGIDPAGVYTLVSVDGLEVPATVTHDEVDLQVHSGTFRINADGTCISMVNYGPPSGGESTREVNATYTLEGAVLTMQWEGAGMTTGTVEGDTFTMENEGMVFVYRISGG